MPKKTKREKRLAQEHKRTQLLQKFTLQEPVFQPVQIEAKKTENISLEPKQKYVKSPLTQEERMISNFFISDFRKSIMLITFIIALEIAVYFGTINNYFKF